MFCRSREVTICCLSYQLQPLSTFCIRRLARSNSLPPGHGGQPGARGVPGTVYRIPPVPFRRLRSMAGKPAGIIVYGSPSQISARILPPRIVSSQAESPGREKAPAGVIRSSAPAPQSRGFSVPRAPFRRYPADSFLVTIAAERRASPPARAKPKDEKHAT